MLFFFGVKQRLHELKQNPFFLLQNSEVPVLFPFFRPLF